MKRGFSLVELSIVLVILGLLTGGILAGQSLIRASELRAVSTEYNRYAAAMQTFRDKYFGLPGDITNATKFWGPSANCPGAYNQGTTNGATCDGNGDGRVYFTGAASAPTANEVHRFWQQLASAGLIEGTYSGVTTGTTGYFLGVDATNGPSSKLGRSVWAVSYFPNASAAFNGSIFAQDYTLIAYLGGVSPELWPAVENMKSEEAWNIDTKMDDGMPGTGLAISRVANSCTTAVTKTDITATYILTNPGVNCRLAFALLK